MPLDEKQIGAGASAGAAIGSAVPIVGTAIGAAIGAVAGAISGFFTGGGGSRIIPRTPYYYAYPSGEVFRLNDFTYVTNPAEWDRDFAARQGGPTGKAGQPVFHTLYIQNRAFNGTIMFNNKLYDRNLIEVIQSGDTEWISGTQVMERSTGQSLTLGSLGVAAVAAQALREVKQEIEKTGGVVKSSGLDLVGGLQSLSLVNWFRDNIVLVILAVVVGVLLWRR